MSDEQNKEPKNAEQLSEEDLKQVAGGGGGLPTVQLTDVTVGIPVIDYSPQDSNGNLSPTGAVGFDVKTNK